MSTLMLTLETPRAAYTPPTCTPPKHQKKTNFPPLSTYGRPPRPATAAAAPGDRAARRGPVPHGRRRRRRRLGPLVVLGPVRLPRREARGAVVAREGQARDALDDGHGDVGLDLVRVV